MRPRMAVIDGGTYYHHRALHGDRYRGYIDQVIYARDLAGVRLADFEVVVVPDRLHPGLLIAAADQFRAYLDGGGTVVALAELRAHEWLPGVTWEHRPTNFWWWKTPGASLGLEAHAPEHPLWRHIALEDATWHYHGVFSPPSGATPLIGVASGGVVLYEDVVSTPGRLIISSLDPFYHYGSYFMPVTARFLDGFLPWLREPWRSPPAAASEE